MFSYNYGGKMANTSLLIDPIAYATSRRRTNTWVMIIYHLFLIHMLTELIICFVSSSALSKIVFDDGVWKAKG